MNHLFYKFEPTHHESRCLMGCLLYTYVNIFLSYGIAKLVTGALAVEKSVE